MSHSRITIEMPVGSIEYLYVDLRTDRVLDAQAVSVSLSQTNEPSSWQPATWVGEAGKFRSARILLDGTLAPGSYRVFAKITDMPEAPIVLCGSLKII